MRCGEEEAEADERGGEMEGGPKDGVGVNVVRKDDGVEERVGEPLNVDWKPVLLGVVEGSKDGVGAEEGVGWEVVDVLNVARKWLVVGEVEENRETEGGRGVSEAESVKMRSSEVAEVLVLDGRKGEREGEGLSVDV